MPRNKLSALALMLLLLAPGLLPLQAMAQTLPLPLRDPGTPLPDTGDVNGLQTLLPESDIRVSPGYTVRNALGMPIATFAPPPPPLAPVAMRASAPRLPTAEAPAFVEFDVVSDDAAASGPLVHVLSLAALPGSVPPLAPRVTQDAAPLAPGEYRVERVNLPVLLPGDYAANLTVFQKSPDGSLAPLASLPFPLHVDAPRLEGDGREYVRVVNASGAVALQKQEWYWGNIGACANPSSLRRCNEVSGSGFTNHGSGDDAWHVVRASWTGDAFDSWGLGQAMEEKDRLTAWEQAQKRARAAASASSVLPAVAIALVLDKESPEILIEPQTSTNGFVWG